MSCFYSLSKSKELDHVPTRHCQALSVKLNVRNTIKWSRSRMTLIRVAQTRKHLLEPTLKCAKSSPHLTCLHLRKHYCLSAKLPTAMPVAPFLHESSLLLLFQHESPNSKPPSVWRRKTQKLLSMWCRFSTAHLSIRWRGRAAAWDIPCKWRVQVPARNQYSDHDFPTIFK